MNLHVGVSGYSYKEWKGSFYPADLPAKQMLRFYSENFSAVEINNTFYRMPKESLLEGWAKEVPATFKFALKAPQKITHFLKLRDAEDAVKQFLKVASVLKTRLGPLLFQTPPYLKLDVPLLREFLTLLPPKNHYAFEFRHASWFTDDVFKLLRHRNAALCIAQSEDGVDAPFEATADWGYCRPRRLDYKDAQLKSWLLKVRQQRWSEAFIFFKHEDQALGPGFAKRFLQLAARPVAKR